MSGVPGQLAGPARWFAQPELVGATHARVGGTAVLKLVNTGAETGEQLIVAPGTLGLADRETVDAAVEPLTAGGFRRHWLTGTTAGRLTLLGLLLAALGQGVGIALDLGDVWSPLHLSKDGQSLAKAAKGVLILGGAGLAFWQAVLKS